MYKAEKYRRDTAATNGSAGFSSNCHGLTSEAISGPPLLATIATSDILELASAFSLAANAQSTKIIAIMAAMIDQRITTNTNNAHRNIARQGGNQQGKKKVERKNTTSGRMVLPRTWNTTVVRVTINTWTTRKLQRSTTAWADQNTYVDPAKTLADLDMLTEAEERQYLV